MIIRQDRLGREKERGNDKRAGAAGARAEEADGTHLPPHRRSMVNSRGVVGVAQLVERRSVACTLYTPNTLIRHRLFCFWIS